MKKPTAFLLAAGLSLSAFAAPETFIIDNAHTFPRFEYSHFGYSNPARTPSPGSSAHGI